MGEKTTKYVKLGERKREDGEKKVHRLDHKKEKIGSDGGFSP